MNTNEIYKLEIQRQISQSNIALYREKLSKYNAIKNKDKEEISKSNSIIKKTTETIKTLKDKLSKLITSDKSSNITFPDTTNINLESPIHLPIDTLEISSPYGYRSSPADISTSKIEPERPGWQLHKGVDIIIKSNEITNPIFGQPIYSPFNGKIVIARAMPGNSGNLDNVIRIQHNEGKITGTEYHHLDTIMVTQNQEVKKGQQIGTVGNTGTSSGPHLHFEAHVNNMIHRDPIKYIAAFKSVSTRKEYMICANRFGKTYYNEDNDKIPAQGVDGTFRECNVGQPYPTMWTYEKDKNIDSITKCPICPDCGRSYRAYKLRTDTEYAAIVQKSKLG